ncbi:MAG: bifunctional folylpolyglutamate synthase/dihydrofolate synthase [Endozoicomonadaceae bacterium]|nr:bifunctional folylpolyglutamate synthase/dihydrofolate synthase [Endozoicomonadaceae bacterium]
MSFKSLDLWFAYLTSRQSTDTINLGLERIACCLIDVIGHQKLAKTIITIAGTNGKGSTVAYLESILKHTDLTYASTTSPHLYQYNERICFQGVPVSDDKLADTFNFLDTLNSAKKLTFFEWMFAAACYLFIQTPLDVVILEVGLGGRLDAINAIDPDISVITTVDLDHIEYLGSTIELIAKEKAGIMRKGKPIIYGDSMIPNSILEHAYQVGAIPFFRGIQCQVKEYEHDWDFQGLQVNQQDYYLKSLPKPQLPLTSAFCALQAALLIGHPGITRDHLVDAVKNAQLSGRNELLPYCTDRQKKVTILLDVAHNPQSGRYLAQKIINTPCSGRRFALIAMLNTKDFENTLSPFFNIFDQWCISSIQNHQKNTLNGKIIASWLIQKNQAVLYYNNIKIAAVFILNHMEHDDQLVVFGSFYTIHEFRVALSDR